MRGGRVRTRARHRVRHRPAPDPAGASAATGCRDSTFAGKHRVPARARAPGRASTPSCSSGDMTRLQAARARRRGHLHAGLPGPSADERGDPRASALRRRGRSGPAGSTSSTAYMCSSWTEPGAALVVDAAARARRSSGPRSRRSRTSNPVTQVFYEHMELEVHGERRRARSTGSATAPGWSSPRSCGRWWSWPAASSSCEWFYGFKPHLSWTRRSTPC